MPVRPPFRYSSQAVAYVSITPFVGAIGQEMTRGHWTKRRGTERWGDPSPCREAVRSKVLQEREPSEQGKNLGSFPSNRMGGRLIAIALNTWLTGLVQYSHRFTLYQWLRISSLVPNKRSFKSFLVSGQNLYCKWHTHNLPYV
jgi:hypothetical protein